jgi:ABC-type bacteriocin/lantibiotic exporter with double-glycine peptidase domain
LILIASVLINLTELSSPLYINIVYTSVLPSGSMSSLVVLTIAVVVLMLLGGWLRTVRLALTGSDGARIEHHKRLDAISHFLGLGLGDFLRVSPGGHLQRLSSINLLRDESALQSLTTAIDLGFSLLFVLVLFLIAGSVGLVAVVAIIIYVFKALSLARRYEVLSRRRDRMELETRNYQDKMIGSLDLIRSNGLGSRFLVDGERYQEQLARERLNHTTFIGQYQAFGSLVGQLTFAAGVTWGAILVINDRLLVGALAAALLLLGKILNPWQQAMGLWNSYRRMAHSRDEYDELMATPVESEGGQALLSTGAMISVSRNRSPLLALPAGSSALLRDQRFGMDTRELFQALIQVGPACGLELNGVPLEDYQRDPLRQAVMYVNPSRQFFQGTLLDNLTSFQPSRYRRKALFWSFMTGFDTLVSALPKGYATVMGGQLSSGLSRDGQYLAHVITALSRQPQLLLLDLSDCSYGKSFIDSLQLILRRLRGRSTVLIGGGGKVLTTLTDQQVDLQPQLQEAR